MDRQTEWPWSWEEEAEWKAELEERDNAFVEELIEDAVEERVTDSRYALGLPAEGESGADRAPDKYLVVT